ncbi:DNA replication initiation protein [Lactobacillus sp.] [Lactiplantibacillus mudanjiangensis]|uniref:DUF2075 domain-containing protein n=1 Tax=Lactiplantibacillus mudanjiangensis TaxID=1296538 RepID=UPI0010150B0A|nr:DUF2075 domain-containing protein [Lactiplantibacillus mudanjiangensis]VDG21054.1 DNA replication initiation protein [Lactobacillus sp.] [Lactiplantibacillus mudanjiangensis]VDG31649.1 DNA replication initiation protein [Lactobacillus sp.] [Lactiplantibacillus mudanjiangensis]
MTTELSAATFKLADAAALSPAQQQLEHQLLNFIQQHLTTPTTGLFVIQGDAGTGKSAVLAAAFTKLQALSRQAAANPLQHTDNYLVVNHNEMLKIYKRLAGDDPDLRKKDFQKPTPLINRLAKSDHKADVVFVDEAHLLLTQPDRYNRFDQQNQLHEIIKHSRVVVLVFDPHQVLKLKSYWQADQLAPFLAHYPHEIFNLDEQFRVTGNAEVVNWIDGFTHGKLLAKPHSPQFDFQIFDDGQPLYDLIRRRDAKSQLSRVVATADFPYVVNHGTWYVTAGSLKLPWDKVNLTDDPWALRPETLNEVGSIYTIQGFDLNYAGVILGPSVGYDPKTNHVIVRPDRYEDQEAFKNRDDLGELAPLKAQIIFNSINVLMKRGRYGLYLYACDPVLRQHLLAL